MQQLELFKPLKKQYYKNGHEVNRLFIAAGFKDKWPLSYYLGIVLFAYRHGLAVESIAEMHGVTTKRGANG